MAANNYNEIVKLHKFCEAKGIKSTLHRKFDGYILVFKTGEMEQHYASRESMIGKIALGYMGTADMSFESVTLDEAKKFVTRNAQKLGMKEVNDD